jgi:hypothetical protein
VPRNPPVTEAIRDIPVESLTEVQVEAIFDELTSATPLTARDRTPDEEDDYKNKEFGRLKSLIRDTMTEDQRQSLWRALHDI